MNKQLDFLDFEQPIVELEARIEALRFVGDDNGVSLNEEIGRLKQKCQSLTKSIFSHLTPWQITQLARHPLRPHSLDYIALICSEFHELHGDRMFADDPSIVAGLARFDSQPVMVIGQQKGRRTEERIQRNFGMPRPEGYRRAQRLMKMAEKFQLPIISFIDTPGAYPGIDAEERGQSEAIASCLALMSSLDTPIVSVVIGEGGSGGALAIGVCDFLIMLEYSVYSVISPEGCAAILWQDPNQTENAAAAMAMTAQQLYKLELVDQVLEEPLGGAHRDITTMSKQLSESLQKALVRLRPIPQSGRVEQRYRRLRAYGRYDKTTN